MPLLRLPLLLLLSLLLLQQRPHVDAKPRPTQGSDVSLCHDQAGWAITFEDLFEDPIGLNASNWHVAHNMTHGPTEKELYVAGGVEVRNGSLVLTTRKQHALGPQGQTYNFTSGWVESSGLRWQKRGRFEVRAKLPSPAVGREGMWPTAWPAHWLMPEPSQTSPPNICWPVGGEIDIMEGFRPRPGGDENRSLHASVLQTYHWVCSQLRFMILALLWTI